MQCTSGFTVLVSDSTHPRDVFILKSSGHFCKEDKKNRRLMASSSKFTSEICGPLALMSDPTEVRLWDNTQWPSATTYMMCTATGNARTWRKTQSLVILSLSFSSSSAPLTGNAIKYCMNMQRNIWMMLRPIVLEAGTQEWPILPTQQLGEEI